MTEKQIFAGNLKYYIERSGLAQRDIANKIGVSESAVSTWILAQNIPRMDKVTRLAALFGCNVSDLVQEHALPVSPEKYMEAVAHGYFAKYGLTTEQEMQLLNDVSQYVQFRVQQMKGGFR